MNFELLEKAITVQRDIARIEKVTSELKKSSLEYTKSAMGNVEIEIEFSRIMKNDKQKLMKENELLHEKILHLESELAIAKEENKSLKTKLFNIQTLAKTEATNSQNVCKKKSKKRF